MIALLFGIACGLLVGYLLGQVTEWSRVLRYLDAAPEDEPVWLLESGIAADLHHKPGYR